jgi:hypothetical protein
MSRKSTGSAPSPLHTAQPSEERKRQQDMLARTAKQESWISRLLRSARSRTGRPKPGNRGGPGERHSE